MVVPSKPTAEQTRLVLEVIGKIGAQIGYPALQVRVMDNWAAASKVDADILLIGSMPDAFNEHPDANLLLQDMQSRLQQARDNRQLLVAKNNQLNSNAGSEQAAYTSVAVQSLAPLAAVVELQSESYPQRSIVGLLASSTEDYSLLRKALSHQGEREEIKGSVALIRTSGVTSYTVGPVYYAGELPWWEWLWYHLSDRPWLLASVAFFVVLFLSILLWHALRFVARRRLGQDG